MVQQLKPETVPEIIYPDSDGQPIAENTKQYQWLVKIKENLEILFASIEDVFIAGDLFWYPVEGSVTTRLAPDVMVVFGRPKGDRSSYKQWEENNIAPQVVFEILSPGNRPKEMSKKIIFYQRYGVEEYYIYDPEQIELTGFLRCQNWLEEIEEIESWTSPRLEIKFELKPDTLEIYYPNGEKFLTSLELNQIREQERLAKEAALLQLEQERQKYQDLLATLQAKGIDLDNL
ncbi:MAG TPA: Uma2 family endonuclease [Nostocaceae cyanobacterium]|nr:Uma2 family endonuclease [Nostocaceae cyanobacterium]